MGKSWDSTGIAFNTEMWAACLNILKPGGYLLAFSGTRTYHRMVCAIEDAGFEIRDMVEWMYGSGFPKSLNVAKGIDEAKGKKISENRAMTGGNYERLGPHTIQTTDAKQFEGYGTALKPAHEPCVLARKPLAESTVVKNVLEYGTGGLNIDASRIEVLTNKELNCTPQRQHARNPIQIGGAKPGDEQPMYSPSGRWPSNLIHDGSDEVLDIFPETAKAGNTKPSDMSKGSSVFGIGQIAVNPAIANDEGGSAARFFYCAKASKGERNRGLDATHATHATHRFGAGLGEGLDPNEPSIDRNHHPTVKPLALTKYLATLIKPPTPSRLLVPFSGSGSEMIGGILAGFEHVTGVELTEEYIPIAQARCTWWRNNPNALDTKPQPIATDENQESLF